MTKKYISIKYSQWIKGIFLYSFTLFSWFRLRNSQAIGYKLYMFLFIKIGLLIHVHVFLQNLYFYYLKTIPSQWSKNSVNAIYLMVAISFFFFLQTTNTYLDLITNYFILTNKQKQRQKKKPVLTSFGLSRRMKTRSKRDRRAWPILKFSATVFALL